jgi:hypothetical protein
MVSRIAAAIAPEREMRMYQRYNSNGWQDFIAQHIDLLIPIRETEA